MISGEQVRRHASEQLVNLANVTGDVREPCIDLAHGRDCTDDLTLDNAKLIARALGLFFGAHRKRTDQIGDDREATPCIARLTGLDRSVQG